MRVGEDFFSPELCRICNLKFKMYGKESFGESERHQFSNSFAGSTKFENSFGSKNPQGANHCMRPGRRGRKGNRANGKGHL
jgi:hypothetical protein